MGTFCCGPRWFVPATIAAVLQPLFVVVAVDHHIWSLLWIITICFSEPTALLQQQ